MEFPARRVEVESAGNWMPSAKFEFTLSPKKTLVEGGAYP